MMRVENHPHLYRDADSKGIINTDIASLQEHRNKRKMTQDIVTINNDINDLKNDMSEIKNLLQILLNK